MSVATSSLPRDVDSFLQSIAQETQMISYSDILQFSKTADAKDISTVRNLFIELSEEFDMDLDDEGAEALLANIVAIVKQ